MANAKWDVNINVQSSSAKTAAAHVDHLEAGLKKADAGAAKATGTFSKFARMLLLNAEGFKGIGAAAGEARSKTGEFLEFFGALAALEVLKDIAEKIVDIGEEAVRSAAKAERMNRVFAIQQGGKSQGKAAQEWVEKFSKTSEFTEAENESAFVNLRKHGVTSQQSGLIMKAAADIAAGSEDRAGAYQEAIGAFTRLQATGRVQARTLMPLGIGIEDFKKMPEFKGMSNQKVNEALAKKNVNQNELFQLIMAHAGESKIGTRSADNVDLLGTKMQKLEELPERFFKKLGDTKAVGSLATALDGLLTKLDPDSPAGERIFGSLEHMFETIAGDVQEIDFDAVADSLKTDVIPAIETMISLIKPTMEIIATTIRGFGVAAHFISGRKTAEEQSKAEANYNANQSAAAGGSIWAKIKAPFMRSDAGINDEAAVETPFGTMTRAEWAKRGGAVAAGAAKGVKDGTTKYEDAISGMSDAGSDTFTSTNEIQSPSKLFQRHGEMLSAGVAVGVQKGTSRIESAMASTFDVPTGGAQTAIGSAAGGITVTLQTTIYVGHGEDGEAQGKKAADAYNAKIREQILSVLEQARAGGGG